MKHLIVMCPLLVLILLTTGCSREQVVEPAQVESDVPESLLAETLAGQLVTLSGWDSEESDFAVPTEGTDHVASIERELIADDIVHYSSRIRVGPGPYDFIGLHRVVRERRPYVPIRTKRSVFLQHGSLVGFEGVFLFGKESPNTPDDYSLAVFLASHNVDVWGIDQSWILVPEDAADLSFMSAWGMQNQIDNLKTGLAVARISRRLTGNGFNKMHLLGYSSGSATGYAYLNEESQRPPGHRHVKGYIPMDTEYKEEIEADRLAACETAAFYQGLYDSGVYADDFGTIFVLMGDLARTDPDGASPIFEGLTNMQAALGLGAWPLPPPDWFHYVAGEFDAEEMPVNLVATRVEAWLDFLGTASPYEATRFDAEFWSVLCDDVDVPWDDHLADITVPILWVGAAGGINENGLYTTTLLGSTDVTSVIASLTPPVDLFLEFGHLDLVLADVAPNIADALVWEPIFNWIDDHAQGGEGLDIADRKRN